MMNSMIKENGDNFQGVREKYLCMGLSDRKRVHKEFLERYDRMLMEDRDKTKYRIRGPGRPP